LVSLVLLWGCCVYSAPGHRGPRSPHFRNGEFRNVHSTHFVERDGWDLLRWQFARNPGLWLDWVPAQPGPAPPRRVHGTALRVTFVNHSTVLVQTEGLNILTDPVYSHRIGPVSWAGPSRVRPPGIRFEDLPPIDVVLVSHNHYDHMDLPTLERLEARDRPRILTGLGNSRFLTDEGLTRPKDLDWWKSEKLGECMTVHAVPAQHGSGRGLCDRSETLWVGFVIETCGGPIYFAGDTGWGFHFAEIRRRFGPMRLSLLPIGAYRPRWFMQGVHIDPAEAVAAHHVLESQLSAPIHFGTFRLGDDGQYESLLHLMEAWDASPQHGRFEVLYFGEAWDVPGLPVVSSRR
jgi:L-ascorbate metabolism protein UlaG (beta-lactamase superfamily)